jgi:hypothetical protein
LQQPNILELGGSNFLDAGLRAGARGWKIFPVNGKKLPLIRWSQEATTDPTTITAWAKRWPGALWARALPEDVLVLDLDRKHGLNGPKEFERLQGRKVEEFDAPRVVTGSGGIHIYTAATGRDFKNSVSLIAPGIDTKTAGGYCLIPSGDGFYRWETSPDTPMPGAPAWAEVAIRREVDLGPCAEARPFMGWTPRGIFILKSACDAIADAPNGKQHVTLNHRSLIVGHYIAGGLLKYEPTVKRLIEAGNKMPNYDPRDKWTDKKVKAIVEKAVGDGMKKPMDGQEDIRETRAINRSWCDPEAMKELLAYAAEREGS